MNQMFYEVLEENKINGIGIPQLTKIPTLFPNWRRSLNCRKGQLFGCIEREWDFKDPNRNKQNAALNVDLF